MCSLICIATIAKPISNWCIDYFYVSTEIGTEKKCNQKNYEKKVVLVLLPTTTYIDPMAHAKHYSISVSWRHDILITVTLGVFPPSGTFLAREMLSNLSKNSWENTSTIHGWINNKTAFLQRIDRLNITKTSRE